MRIPAWVALLCVAALPLLVGCSGDSKTSSVNGVVTDASSRGGASGTTLTLRNNSNLSGISTTTDGNGNYTFNNITDGSYTLIVNKPNYFTTVAGPVTVYKGTIIGENVTIYPLTTPPTGAVVPADGTATVVVFATDNTGATLPSFSAQVNPLPAVLRSTAGPVIITGIAPGTYTVTAQNASATASGSVLVTLQANTLTVVEITTM